MGRPGEGDTPRVAAAASGFLWGFSSLGRPIPVPRPQIGLACACQKAYQSHPSFSSQE